MARARVHKAVHRDHAVQHYAGHAYQTYAVDKKYGWRFPGSGSQSGAIFYSRAEAARSAKFYITRMINEGPIRGDAHRRDQPLRDSRYYEPRRVRKWSGRPTLLHVAGHTGAGPLTRGAFPELSKAEHTRLAHKYAEAAGRGLYGSTFGESRRTR